MINSSRSCINSVALRSYYWNCVTPKFRSLIGFRTFSMDTEEKAGDVAAACKQTGGGKISLQPPKGMRDRTPQQMAVREQVFSTITKVFKRHDAECIETPVTELKEVLTGKYGEDSKLIYDVADQGGQMLSLRYDLTVPFARYVAMNKVQSMRRYQIGTVYRRDQPSITRGRYREFYQCDLDIAGQADLMLPDAEIVKIVCEILHELEFTDFTIKVNHRKFLDGLFECCGVPESLFRPICSAVDKLDKCEWEEVAKEMEDKGLGKESIECIRSIVLMPSGQKDLVENLRANSLLKDNSRVKQALDEIEVLLKYCELMQCISNVRFDLSLARGLDYYTGVIYEAVLAPVDKVNVGSVAGGGRYDNLVGMFTKKSIPCVGVSLGVERLFTLLEARILSKKKKIKTTSTDVLVCSAHKNLVEQRLSVCGMLWASGINATHPLTKNPKLLTQFQYCEDNEIPVALVLGDSELAAGKVKLRLVSSREERLVSRDELCSVLLKLLEALKSQPQLLLSEILPSDGIDQH